MAEINVTLLNFKIMNFFRRTNRFMHYDTENLL